MNKRTNLILFVVFIILIVVAAQPLWGKLIELPNQNQNLPQNLLGSIDTLTKLEFQSGPGAPVVLTKTDTGWMVSDFKASQTKVDELLTEFRNFQLDSLVSTNPDNETQFGVASSSGTLAVLTTPEGQKTFFVGAQGPRSSTYFIKPKESNTVYLANGDLTKLVNQSANDWRDKTLVDISPEQIKEITVKYQGKVITVSKNTDGKWQANWGKQTKLLGDVTADRLTQTINPLTGNMIATPDQITDVKNARDKGSVTFVITDGRTKIVSVVKTGNGWFAQGPDNDMIVSLPDDKVKSFMTDLVALFN